MTAALSMVPEPTPTPSPAEAEAAVRAELGRLLSLTINMRSPTWRQVLFSSRPIEFKVPTIPAGALDAIDRAQPATIADDDTVKAALGLIGALQASRPRGAQPRSISARRPLPPSRDAMGAWLRKVFLTAAGPEALRLLTASGALTSGDVDTVSAAYPAGTDAERMGAVEAAGAVTAAATRNRQEADLPPWLNDQLMTLMDEHRPTEFLQGLYANEPEPEQQQGGGPSPSAPRSNLVQQSTPDPSPGGMS